MQVGFMPIKGTGDSIDLEKLRDKYLAKKKNLLFVFVDLEKAFDHR